MANSTWPTKEEKKGPNLAESSHVLRRRRNRASLPGQELQVEPRNVEVEPLTVHCAVTVVAIHAEESSKIYMVLENEFRECKDKKELCTSNPPAGFEPRINRRSTRGRRQADNQGFRLAGVVSAEIVEACASPGIGSKSGVEQKTRIWADGGKKIGSIPSSQVPREESNLRVYKQCATAATHASKKKCKCTESRSPWNWE
ncbi:hypothetical protein FB45DRAFT_871188 [Roridomyces roridus]|uniref:Uncharacterized protein n=1 Tax=Roridomyces roridus TaxID=1738132 RepID=A0AAD7BGA7_9AGAR|nr:hypothetical protein FB45DRAFT_871188 [Roridomyces roridus]